MPTSEHPPRLPPPPGNDAWRAAVGQLSRALAASRYAELAALPTQAHPLALRQELRTLRGLLRGDAESGLFSPSVYPQAYVRLSRWRWPRAATLWSAFFHNQPVPTRPLRAALGAPDLLEELLEAGILSGVAEGVRSLLRFVPLEGLLLVTDPDDYSIPRHTYIGGDSLVLARMLRSRVPASFLDMCSGTGAQGLLLARRGAEVTGVEENPRAVAFARLNAELNGLRADFRHGDVYRGLERSFELIAANPPYVWRPDLLDTSTRAAAYGLDVYVRILEGLPERLAEGGEAVVVCGGPVLSTGEAVLPELTREALAGSDLGGVLTELSYSSGDEHFAEFQRRRGLSYMAFYALELDRGARGLALRAPRGRRLRVAAARLATRWQRR